MTAFERLQQQIDDLAVGYIADDAETRPLMQQLLILGPHERASNDIVGKTRPASRPPGNLTARQLYDTVLDEALDWAWTLGGTRIKRDRCLQTIPILVGQRLDSNDRDRIKILHGYTGLFSCVGRWHLKVRIFLRYDKPADRYPSAQCPHCQYRDESGAGSIRARDMVAFCANPDCRDDHNRRHEWNRIVLEELVRDALRVDVA